MSRRREGRELTSVEPGSICSLACSLAPEASWISLIFDPAFPMTEPMRELGMMKLWARERKVSEVVRRRAKRRGRTG